MGILEDAVLRARGSMMPVRVHLDLTYRCHQRCVHCYLPESWRAGAGSEAEMTTAKIKDILDQLAEAGTFLLTFSGGEVFLRPDLFEILEHARRKKFAISLMTSGTCGLKEDRLRFLRELGLNGLVMTLFSLNPVIHDRITQFPGSWEILWRVLQRGQALGLPIVLNCIAMRPNRPGIKEVHAFAGSQGIPLRLNVKLDGRWDGSLLPDGLELPEEERIEVFEELGEEETIELDCTPSDLPPGGCGAGWDHVLYHPTRGTLALYGCPISLRQFTPGGIFCHPVAGIRGLSQSAAALAGISGKSARSFKVMRYLAK